MTVRERPALRVLPGQADGDSLDEQAGEGEVLGLSPVDRSLVQRGNAPLELARELGMDGEVGADADQLLVERVELVGGDSSDDLGRNLGGRRRVALIVVLPCRSCP